jgi:hypothetical protein
MKLTSKGQVTIRQALRKRLQRLKAALRRSRGSAETGLSTAEVMRLTRGE